MEQTALIETNRYRRGHAFYPTAAAALPALYETEGTPFGRKVIHLHYFAPYGDWYIAEYDPQERLGFGYARLAAAPDCAEWGYISLAELEQLDASPFLVERDHDFTPIKFGDITFD